MRIITGKYKGKRLNAPKDNKVRPTTDKVKEAIFSSVENYVCIEDAVVADLFAGTGNLGLEALSRNAKLVYFSDNNGESIRLIKENVNICEGSYKNAKIFHCDYSKAIDKIKREENLCDLILVDPPYHLNVHENVIEILSETKVLAAEGVVVVEHSKDTILGEKIGKFHMFKQKKYGIINISLYKICEE